MCEAKLLSQMSCCDSTKLKLQNSQILIVMSEYTRVGRPSAGHREGVRLDWPSSGRILV